MKNYEYDKHFDVNLNTLDINNVEEDILKREKI